MGSSATTRPGRPISAAAATRCCWPTESCVAGRAPSSVDAEVELRRQTPPSGTGVLPAPRCARTLLRRGRQASGMLSRADSQGSRLKSWNTKPTWSARKRSRPPADSAPSAPPADLDRAGLRQDHPADQRQQRGLTAPLGPRRKTRSPAPSCSVDRQPVLQRCPASGSAGGDAPPASGALACPLTARARRRPR